MQAHKNPFRTDRLYSLKPRLEQSPEDVITRLQQLNFRAAIVGPQGSGKTLILNTLKVHLETEGFQCRYLRLLHPEKAQITPGEILLLDGTELLSPLRWMLFLFRARKASGIVIALHRPGRFPTLLETETSISLLKELLIDLVGTEALIPSPEELYYRHNGNIREVFREYYDFYSKSSAYFDCLVSSDSFSESGVTSIACPSR